MRTPRLERTLSILVCAGVLLLGCAGGSSSSGKKKPRRDILSTEYDDARVGKESSAAVASQMGLLEDEAMNRLVQEMGRKLLRGVPRRNFDFQFRVVDQTEPNAFALPGGYIFVSRGLLALANNEDELACVIGHEITHAIHRHAATQQAMQARSNPLVMGYRRAAKQASYSREMERDADKGGQILCAAAGYDPMGMSTFLNNLGQVERLQLGFSRGQSFFDSHPGSQERAAVNAIRAQEMRWTRDPAIGDPKASYLRRVDGLAVGQRPEAGVFVGQTFIHPDLDFKLRFPNGWQTQNTGAAVAAGDPRGRALVMLEANMPEGDPETIATQWVEKSKEEGARIEVEQSQPVKVGDIDAWRMKLKVATKGGHLASYVTFIPYRGITWRITGMSRASDQDTYLKRTLPTARSFRPLTAQERNSIESQRLRLVNARSGEGIDALGKRSNNAWNVPTTAVYNGVFIDHRFAGGELVKVTNVERYVPKGAKQ